MQEAPDCVYALVVEVAIIAYIDGDMAETARDSARQFARRDPRTLQVQIRSPL